MAPLGSIHSLNPHGRLGGLTNLQYPRKNNQTVYNTIYINGATGSDANTGYKPSAPKATIQNANDSWRIGILYILIAGGTYAEWPVISANVEFKGSYDSTFTTQDFVATPTILAKAGAGVSGYALTFTADTNNGCEWDKIESNNLGVAGLPARNIVIWGSPKIGMATARTLAANGDAGYSTSVDNSTATDTLIIDGLLIKNENDFPAGNFVGLNASANAKVLCRNILVATSNAQNSDGVYTGLQSVGGGSFIVENATITGTGLRGNSRGIRTLGSGVTIKNTIINGFYTYGIETSETIIAENNNIYGAATAWTGSVAPVGAYITTDPKLDMGVNVGRLTTFVSGDWAAGRCPQSCNHTVNGINYIYVVISPTGEGGAPSQCWRTADGINWEMTGTLSGIGRNSGVLISYNGKLYLMGGSDSASLNSVVSSSNGTIWSSEINGDWSARYMLCAFVLNGLLYVTAGQDGTGRCQDMWSWDGAAASWTDCTVTGTKYSARGWARCEVLGTKAYIMGGNDTGITNTVWSWDGSDTKWVSETSFTSASYYFGSTVLNGKIYIALGLGSAGKQNIIQSFDGASWAAEYTADWDVRFAQGMGHIGSDLFVFGGTGASAAISDTWKNTPATNNTWAQTYTNTGIPQSGTPPVVSQGGTDLSAEFTTDRDGSVRTAPWSMGCYNKPTTPPPAVKASFKGTISAEVMYYIEATQVGAIGNCTITGDGVHTTIELVADWNSSNPTQTVNLISTPGYCSGLEIPTNGWDINLIDGTDLVTSEVLGFAGYGIIAPVDIRSNSWEGFTLYGDGTTDLDTLIADWNLISLGNQLTLTAGDGTQILDNGATIDGPPGVEPTIAYIFDYVSCIEAYVEFEAQNAGSMGNSIVLYGDSVTNISTLVETWNLGCVVGNEVVFTYGREYLPDTQITLGGGSD